MFVTPLLPQLTLSTGFIGAYPAPAPIPCIDAVFNVAMERGKRPLRDFGNMAMLYRIPMHIVHMIRQIPFVTDRVLPVPPMPDTPLMTPFSHCRKPLAFRQTLDEQQLDQTPASRVIRIARRQRPYAMQMVGQHHPRHDLERIPALHPAHRFPQPLNLRNQQIPLSLKQSHRKKVRPARNPVPPIIRHPPTPFKAKPTHRFADHLRRADSERSDNPPYQT